MAGQPPPPANAPEAPAASVGPVDVELGLPPQEEQPEPLQEQARKKLLQLAEDAKAKDPVKKGRFSLGTLTFSVIGLCGLVFLVVGIAEKDAWEILSCLFVISLSGYAVVYLGGDPCLLEAFRKQVNAFRKENLRFKASNGKLEERLQSLSGVADDLEEVRKQMGSDIEAATRLLENMRRFSALQTVSVVVNQFFAADWDGSGHVSGDEAQILVPQLSSLWVLVPDFDPERLLQHVQDYGLTLGQLSGLLDHVVADDSRGCNEELERLIATRQPKAAAAEANAQAEGEEAWQTPVQAPPQAQLEELYEEASMQFGEWMNQQLSQLQDLGKDMQKDTDEEALKPWFQVGPLTVWSPLHLALILSTLLGLVFAVAAFVVLELTNVVSGLVGLALAGGLMAASRLIEVLKALRREVGTLRGQNDRLEVIHEDLSKQVTHLSKIQKGYQTLQAECGGNVEMARDLIQKSNTNTKMSAMAVITRFFKDADLNRNHKLDPEEVESFVERLQLAFRSVEGFDAARLRAAATGMGVRELRSLVDLITTIEGPEAPLPPPPDVPAPASAPAAAAAPAAPAPAPAAPETPPGHAQPAPAYDMSKE